MIYELLIGAGVGAAFLATVWWLSNEALAQVAFAALVSMLSIYVGAHLVTSGLARVLGEATFFSIVAVLALFLKDRWPTGIGLLTVVHGGYDLLFGHASEVAHWYPGVCVGFDLLVGSALIARFSGVLGSGHSA